MNKAYRTLLAGVLSILFVGPAMGQDAGVVERSIAPAAKQDRDPVCCAATPTRYTGTKRTERMPT
ncbi:MAG: hypothetical protein P8Y54_07230 [Xanthomonadales bacterium]